MPNGGSNALVCSEILSEFRLILVGGLNSRYPEIGVKSNSLENTFGCNSSSRRHPNIVLYTSCIKIGTYRHRHRHRALAYFFLLAVPGYCGSCGPQPYTAQTLR